MTYLDTRELWTELYDLRERNEQAYDDSEPLDEDEAERLKALEELAAEIGEDLMRDGETMIPESDFSEYAQELAEDFHGTDYFSTWPFNSIDWDAAADNLADDFTSVTFDGSDYYVRTY